MGRKRKNGEGTVRLRKDGRWEGRVVIGYDDKGLPKTKNVLAKTKSECVEKLKTLKDALAPPAPPRIKADMPFGDWMEHWYETYSKPAARPGTRRIYEGYLRLYIRPELGHIPLNRLTAKDMQQFFAWLKTEGRADQSDGETGAGGLPAPQHPQPVPAGTGKGSIGKPDSTEPGVRLQAAARPKRGNEYPLAGVHAKAADPGEGGKVLRVVPAGICHRTAAGRADGPAMGRPEFDHGRTANQQAGGGHRLGIGHH